jgi:mannuronan synthase
MISFAQRIMQQWIRFLGPQRWSQIRSLLPWLHWLTLAGIGYLSMNTLAQILTSDEVPNWAMLAEVFTLSSIGIWRWGWFLIRWVRSQVYEHLVFRIWRRRARAIPLTDLPPVCLVVPTFKEQPWITERVFRAIAHEAKRLAHPITVLVNSSGDAENALVRSILEAEDPGLTSIRLIEMTQKHGKRKAMADGLRLMLAENLLPMNAVVALMDGDSELTLGTLRNCLPFFCLFPKVGALTTDEMPIVEGSYFFSEWFHLRFAQRHQQMCADSLSKGVMCLTGRFSLFRAEAALNPGFANQLEDDRLDDWLWGNFKFLSGDDKSTWFWLLQRRYQMLYIPDVVVYSIETISGSVPTRIYQNMRRWYGNMLRNNGRALALGPWHTGPLMWYALLDQRISIWTSLVSPCMLLTAVFQGHWNSAKVIACWIISSRILMMMITFAGRKSHLKLIHLPTLLLTQWASSLVKIWTQMHQAKQKWTNRGNQSLDAGGQGWVRWLQERTAQFLLIAQMFAFFMAILWMNGLVSPLWDNQGWQAQAQPTEQVQHMDALAAGVVPSDQRDDGVILQRLIDRALATPNPRQQPIHIDLPIGSLTLTRPLRIPSDRLTLVGQGIDRTVLDLQAPGGIPVIQSPPTHKAVPVLQDLTLQTQTQHPELNLRPQQLQRVQVRFQVS